MITLTCTGLMARYCNSVTNITFQFPGNIFYSGARLCSIEWEDLWLMFHQKWLDLNLLVVWCL
jgi:hypothetical protein